MLHPKVALVLRILFGLFLLFLALIHVGHDATGPNGTQVAMDFEQATIDTGYIYPVLALFELFAGLALLANRYAALMLVVTFPITLNFVLFKAFLDVSTLPVAAVMMGIHVMLLFAYREAYSGMLRSKTT